LDFVIFRKGDAEFVCKKNKFFKALRVKKKSRKKKNSFARTFLVLCEKRKTFIIKPSSLSKNDTRRNGMKSVIGVYGSAAPHLSAERKMKKYGSKTILTHFITTDFYVLSSRFGFK